MLVLAWVGVLRLHWKNSSLGLATLKLGKAPYTGDDSCKHSFFCSSSTCLLLPLHGGGGGGVQKKQFSDGLPYKATITHPTPVLGPENGYLGHQNVELCARSA